MSLFTNYARSMNETHRICTHEISGHLHLVRFCIDELAGNITEDSPNYNIVEKLNEGVSKLEDLNKLLKMCTRYIDAEDGYTLETLVERPVSIARVYYHKQVPSIKYKVNNSIVETLERGTILSESIFSVISLFSYFAIESDLKNLEFSFEGKIEGEKTIIDIHSNINKVCRNEAVEVLQSGNENDKTLRRCMGLNLLVENGGSYNFIDDNNFLVRLEL